MSLEKLPKDLILIVWAFIRSNKSMTSLVTSCRYFKKLGDRYGYIKTYNLELNNYNFLRKLLSKNIFFDKFITRDISRPSIMLNDKAGWPRVVVFDIGRDDYGFGTIKPPLSPKTEVIKISIDKRYVGLRNSQPLTVVWCMFPNLKVLDIEVDNVALSGLMGCKKLEKIKINISGPVAPILPDFFATLPNLKILATNCRTINPLHFISKKLQICHVDKTSPFTSDSIIVPDRHLQSHSRSSPYSYINLRTVNMYCEDI